eukprot:COSAG06_NODE_49320_length_326_cov_0.806167_1_plen_29_part_10
MVTVAKIMKNHAQTMLLFVTGDWLTATES